MDAPNGEVRLPQISSVIFGRGSVQRLGEMAVELGAKRAMVVTVPTLANKTDLVKQIQTLLGDKCAGIFAGAVQHAPYQSIVEGAKMAKELGADMFVSLGGSSAGDTAKGINLALAEAEGEDYEKFFAKYARQGEMTNPQFNKPKLPQIAIPTTLSGGEFSSSIGITDAVLKHKFALVDAKIIPKVIILDPDVTVYTSAELWASTCLKVLADSFEMVCSPRHLPFVDALALQAIKLINRYLIPSIGTPLDFGARAMLQHAAWMSESVKAFTGLGIVTALRHQVGGRYNIAHGIASSIVFPAGINFNRPVIDERLALVAEALGLPATSVTAAAGAAVKRAEELIKEAALPTRLRDVMIPKEDLGKLAEAVMHDRQLRNNPKPVHSVEEITGVLEQMW